MPPVSQLVIPDFDTENAINDKILFVKDIITTDRYFYDIYFNINPTSADRDIKATLNIDIGDICRRRRIVFCPRVF
ncbi:MAG: hypothetical protein MZU97_04530 [Bacillus subtilis]|nr:hypothetical protein [Bacillus subtilis]